MAPKSRALWSEEKNVLEAMALAENSKAVKGANEKVIKRLISLTANGTLRWLGEGKATFQTKWDSKSVRLVGNNFSGLCAFPDNIILNIADGTLIARGKVYGENDPNFWWSPFPVIRVKEEGNGFSLLRLYRLVIKESWATRWMEKYKSSAEKIIKLFGGKCKNNLDTLEMHRLIIKLLSKNQQIRWNFRERTIDHLYGELNGWNFSLFRSDFVGDQISLSLSIHDRGPLNKYATIHLILEGFFFKGYEMTVEDSLWDNFPLPIDRSATQTIIEDTKIGAYNELQSLENQLEKRGKNGMVQVEINRLRQSAEAFNK